MYGYNKKVDLEFNEATEKVRDELKRNLNGLSITYRDISKRIRAYACVRQNRL